MDKFITPPFRGSFVNLTEPHRIGDGDPKYQITIVLPKEDKFWQKIKAEIALAIEDKWGKKPAKCRLPVKDGDAEDCQYPEFAGCYTLQCSTKTRPDVCDASTNPILEPDQLYSGAYFRASINAFAWTHPTGGKGVSFGLNTIMKVKDGDPLGGRGVAADDFADYAEYDAGSEDAPESAEGLLG